MTNPIPLPFTTAAVGISNYREAAATLTEGCHVQGLSEPDNPADPNAIRICAPDGRTVGYLPAPLASRLQGDGEATLEGRVSDVLGDPGTDGGVRIRWHQAGSRHTTPREVSEPPGGQDGPQERPRPGGSDMSEPVVVRSLSGATLGELVGRSDRLIRVRRPDGDFASYPRSTVDEASLQPA